MFFSRRSTGIAMVLLVALIGAIIAADLSSRPSSSSLSLISTPSPVTLAPGAILSRPTMSLSTFLQGNSCLPIIQAAFNATDAGCQATGRNQVCYGNSYVEAQPQTGVSDFVFSVPGDIEDTERLLRLYSAPMDEADGTWGIALLQLQAGLPDTLPGQNVTMLVFGDVETENAVAGAGSQYDPMQAFYLHTGFGDAPCLAAPDSGILLQAPTGTGTIHIIANEVDIEFDGMLYSQARPSGDMLIYVLSGQSSVTAFGATIGARAGEVVEIPLSANLSPIGRPGVTRFNPNQPALQALPLRLLPVSISILTPSLIATPTP